MSRLARPAWGCSTRLRASCRPFRKTSLLWRGRYPTCRTAVRISRIGSRADECVPHHSSYTLSPLIHLCAENRETAVQPPRQPDYPSSIGHHHPRHERGRAMVSGDRGIREEVRGTQGTGESEGCPGSGGSSGRLANSGA